MRETNTDQMKKAIQMIDGHSGSLETAMSSLLLQFDDSIGLFGEIQIMGDHDECVAMLGADSLQDVNDALCSFDVKIARRFVRKDDVGIVDKGTRDGDTLLFTAGQFARAVVESFRQAECFEPFFCVVIDFVAVDAPLEGGQGGVFQGGQFGKKKIRLENEANALFAEFRQGGG